SVLARDVDDLAVGPNRDALRFLADLHRGHNSAGRQIDDAYLRRIFVGDVQPRAVRTDVHLLGIGARVDDPPDFVRRRVHFADPVGAAIGRRKGLGIDAGP